MFSLQQYCIIKFIYLTQRQGRAWDRKQISFDCFVYFCVPFHTGFLYFLCVGVDICVSCNYFVPKILVSSFWFFRYYNQSVEEICQTYFRVKYLLNDSNICNMQQSILASLWPTKYISGLFPEVSMTQRHNLLTTYLPQSMLGDFVQIKPDSTH